jgi:hypothetical protein
MFAHVKVPSHVDPPPTILANGGTGVLALPRTW